MKFDTYMVGGCVRDEIMGLKSKDIDFVMLAPSFEAMRAEILKEGHTIFLEKPEYQVIRAHHAVFGAVDYTLARKDGKYSDGRHPDNTTIVLELEQDLARRDFTCNAIAKDIRTGEIVDPFFGRRHIADKMLHAVGNAHDRFAEDRLRVFRALRFSIQKGFTLSSEIIQAINTLNIKDYDAVSTERIREELLKMFVANTRDSITLLSHEFPQLFNVLLSRGIWFQPTTKKP